MRVTLTMLRTADANLVLVHKGGQSKHGLRRSRKTHLTTRYRPEGRPTNRKSHTILIFRFRLSIHISVMYTIADKSALESGTESAGEILARFCTPSGSTHSPHIT